MLCESASVCEKRVLEKWDEMELEKKGSSRWEKKGVARERSESAREKEH